MITLQKKLALQLKKKKKNQSNPISSIIFVYS